MGGFNLLNVRMSIRPVRSALYGGAENEIVREIPNTICHPSLFVLKFAGLVTSKMY